MTLDIWQILSRLCSKPLEMMPRPFGFAGGVHLMFVAGLLDWATWLSLLSEAGSAVVGANS
jgi:hypothetical protein